MTDGPEHGDVEYAAADPPPTYEPPGETKGWVVSSPITVPEVEVGPIKLPPSTSGPSGPTELAVETSEDVDK